MSADCPQDMHSKSTHPGDVSKNGPESNMSERLTEHEWRKRVIASLIAAGCDDPETCAGACLSTTVDSLSAGVRDLRAQLAQVTAERDHLNSWAERIGRKGDGCPESAAWQDRAEQAEAREAVLLDALQSVRAEIENVGRLSRSVFDLHGLEDELATIDLALANPSPAADRLLAAQRVAECFDRQTRESLDRPGYAGDCGLGVALDEWRALNGGRGNG